MKSNTLLIISCFDIIGSNTAAEHRVKLYIKSLIRHNNINKIYLFYSNTLWTFDKDLNVINQKRTIKQTVKLINRETPIFIYPSTNVLKVFYYLFYFKLIHVRKLFIEANEIRKYSTTLYQGNLLSLIRYKLILKKFLSIIYDYSIKYFDGIISISENIKRYYSQINKNILIIPILSEIPNEINSYRTYNYNSPFIITFTGTVNIKKENLDILFEAISMVNSNIQLHLYGPINNYNLNVLNELIIKLSLSNRVFYKGFVSQEVLKDIFNESHLLILPRGNIKQNQYGFSTKLSEYLVSGRPVLVTNVSDNGKYIFDMVNGFIIEPDSLNAFVSKIEFIYSNYNKFYTLPKNAINTVKKNFDYKLYTEKLYNFLYK